MKIKAYTSYNDYNRTRYFREFDIVKSIPVVGEDYGSHFGDGVTETVKEVNEVRLDIEQGKDEVWDYDYYEVVTNYYDRLDDETTEETYYIAIEKVFDEDDVVEL